MDVIAALQLLYLVGFGALGGVTVRRISQRQRRLAAWLLFPMAGLAGWGGGVVGQWLLKPLGDTTASSAIGAMAGAFCGGLLVAYLVERLARRGE